jgi:hypothetical protein
MRRRDKGMVRWRDRGMRKQRAGETVIYRDREETRNKRVVNE